MSGFGGSSKPFPTLKGTLEAIHLASALILKEENENIGKTLCEPPSILLQF